MIIMRAAREFRDRPPVSVEIVETPVVEVTHAPSESKKSIFSYLIDFLKKIGK
jgi:hypothetical protein